MATSSSKGKLAHRFYTGSFFPELESALANEIAGFKREHGPLAPLNILVPTNLLKVYLPRRLAESFGGHASLRFQTLTDLVRTLSPTEAKPLPQFADELIIAGLVARRVTRGSYFHPVSEGLGFRAALLSAIRDLKQADISPSELRKAARGLNRAKFAQLADLYEAYESALKEKNFTDDDDLLRLAVKASDSQLSTLNSQLLIYGFYDFNHLQRELIAALARRASTTVFMPYHPNEAFRYAEPTLRWFERTLGVEAEHYADVGDAELPSTLANLRSGLFVGRELRQVGEPDPWQVAILSTPGESREAREMLREAVQFAKRSEKSLHHAAVLARNVENYADPLRDCAASRGCTVHVHGGQSLLQQPVAQAVLLLTRIVDEDFSRRTVLEFLSLSPIRLDEALPEKHRARFLPSAWAQISADAGIVRGADAWLQRTAQWIRSELRRKAYLEERGEPVSPRVEERIAMARAMEAFAQRLFGALATIPRDSKWSTMVAAVERVATQYLTPSDELTSALNCIRDLAALEPIRETVRLADFIEFARKTIEAQRVSDARFEEGGLFVGGLESCRGVTWPMVVIPGLIESSFPRVIREDPILLDQERKVLSEHGGGDRLPLKLTGHDEERLLFQLAVESARERLVLTYPRLDPFNGSPRVPSILLLHVLEALRGGSANFELLNVDPLHRVVPLTETAGDSPGDTLVDVGEYDLNTTHSALRRGVRTLKPYLDTVSPWIAHGLGCERKRWGSPAFTEFDGVFQSKEAKELLARRFDGEVWSVTALERFARSPFQFFLTDVLGIEEFDEPEEAETISALDLGSLWHGILREVVGRFQEEKLWPVRAGDRKRQLDLLHKIGHEQFDRFEKHGVTGYAILWEICREKTLAELEAWLDVESEDGSFTPLHVEYPLPAATVFGVPIKGRADRIDTAVHGGAWRVYDYKTGSKPFKAASFNEGRALQIPLYLLALESAAKQTVSDGYYYYVTRRGGLKRVGWTREQLTAAEPHLQKLVQEIVASIRAGRFFLTDSVTAVAGVTLPEAALKKLMEFKLADPHWTKFAATLEEEAKEDE